MTRNEVIRLAREAGFDVVVFDGVEEVMEGDRYYIQTYLVERFAALVAAQEREACAKVCENMRPSKREHDGRFFDGCTESAAAIRARSNP